MTCTRDSAGACALFLAVLAIAANAGEPRSGDGIPNPSIDRSGDYERAAEAAKDRLNRTKKEKADKFISSLLKKNNLAGSHSLVTYGFRLEFEETHTHELIDAAWTAKPGPHRNVLWHMIAYTKTRAAGEFLSGKLAKGTENERELAAECIAAVELRKSGVQCNLNKEGWVDKTSYPNRQDAFEAADLTHLKYLPKLATLSISSVADGALMEIKDVTTLKSVHLGLRVPLPDDDLKWLQNSRGLRVCNLYWDVTDAGLAHLKVFTALWCLHFKTSNVTDAGLAHLRPLKNLKFLELDDARVTDAGLAHLSGMGELTNLSLAGTRVSDAGLRHLGNMHKLQTLKLDHTSIGDKGLESFREFDALQGISSLSLRHTRITDAGLAHLSEMRNLQRLDLSGNRITDAGLAQLESHRQLVSLGLVGGTISDTAAHDFAKGRGPSFRLCYTNFPAQKEFLRVNGGPPKPTSPWDDLFEPFLRAKQKGAEADMAAVERAAAVGPEVIKPLLASVKQYRVEKEDAARVFQQMGADAIPHLIAAIRQDSHFVTRQVMQTTFCETGVSVVPLMTDLLKDPSPQVRLVALDVLSRLAPRTEKTLPKSLEGSLIDALGDTQCEARCIAASLLGRIDTTPKLVIPALLGVLAKDENSEARRQATGSLGIIGSSLGQGDPHLKRIICAISSAAINDRNWWVRELSVHKLGDLGAKDEAVIPALIHATGDERESVRYQARSKLKSLGVRLDEPQKE